MLRCHGLDHSHEEYATSLMTCHRSNAKLDHHVLAGSVGLAFAPVAEDALPVCCAVLLAVKSEDLHTFAQPVLFDGGLEWVCTSLNGVRQGDFLFSDIH